MAKSSEHSENIIPPETPPQNIYTTPHQTQMREPIAWCCGDLLTTTEVILVALGVIADLVCFYFTFAPSIIARRKGEKITHYWVYHATFAFWLFFSAWGAYFFVIQKFQLVHPGPFCALLCASPFYISREFRDLEKLGFIDIPGLAAPTIGLVLLWIMAEGCTRYYSRRHRERYARTTTSIDL